MLTKTLFTALLVSTAVAHPSILNRNIAAPQSLGAINAALKDFATGFSAVATSIKGLTKENAKDEASMSCPSSLERNS